MSPTRLLAGARRRSIVPSHHHRCASPLSSRDTPLLLLILFLLIVGHDAVVAEGERSSEGRPAGPPLTAHVDGGA